MPWPETGDRAFRFGARACHLAGGSVRGLTFLAMGFREGSDLLIEHLEIHGRNDSLVDPIIYGYRHSLELQIKAAISVLNRFTSGVADFPMGHVLKNLWGKLRSQVWNDLETEERATFEVVERIVLEFHDWDPKGTGFRYPEEGKQFQIDLQNMREVIGRAAAFLDGMIDLWEFAADEAQS